MGGDTPENNYTSTLEMITSDLTCVPNMPSLPVGKQSASASLLGSTIFHCGGFDGVAAWDYEGTCFSYLLATESGRWEVVENDERLVVAMVKRKQKRPTTKKKERAAEKNVTPEEKDTIKRE